MRKSTNIKYLSTNLTFADMVDDLMLGKKKVMSVLYKMIQLVLVEM